MERSQQSRTEAHLLVVDDEPNIRDLLASSLRFAGFEVSIAGDGNGALKTVEKTSPDLVVLDVMLPGLDGVSVCEQIREESDDVPIIMMSARTDSVDVIAGLEAGADDYVTKPFSLEEVITRLRVILRRGQLHTETADEDSTLSYADITLNDDTHEVTKAGEIVELSPTEFNLLRYLMLNAEVVLSKAKILDNVWHYDFGGDGNVVESYISYLRRKIDTSDPQLIHTVRGVGYVLRTPRTTPKT